MAAAKIPPAFLTIVETCTYLKVSESFLLRALRRGKCRGVRVGRQWRIRPEWASQFMESLPPHEIAERESLRMVKR